MFIDLNQVLTISQENLLNEWRASSYNSLSSCFFVVMFLYNNLFIPVNEAHLDSFSHCVTSGKTEPLQYLSDYEIESIICPPHLLNSFNQYYWYCFQQIPLPPLQIYNSYSVNWSNILYEEPTRPSRKIFPPPSLP